MNHMLSMYKANPELMGKLMLGEVVDIGDGLSVKLSRTGFFKWEGKSQDTLDFTFFLEGKEIGGLDQEFGGWIGYEGFDYENGGLSLEEEQANDDLFCKVSKRWVELFKSHAKQVLVWDGV